MLLKNLEIGLFKKWGRHKEEISVYLFAVDVAIINSLSFHFFGDILEQIGGAIAPVEAAAEVDGGDHHADGNDRRQAENQDQWNFG